MPRFPWQMLLNEEHLTRTLARHPVFSSFVRIVHRRMYEMRNGKVLDEVDRTKLQGQDQTTFIKHFVDELKAQARRKEGK